MVLFTMTGRTPFSITWMMSYSIVIVPFVALVAKLGFGEESFRGLAPVVMAIFFDQRDKFVRRGFSQEDDAMRRIDGYVFDLVTR